MNLLINPNFDLESASVVGLWGGFYGWERLWNHWLVSKKPQNPSPNDTAAKLGQDMHGGSPGGWPTGASDLLWQIVMPSGSHTQVTFKATEIQHMQEAASGLAEIRIYGGDGTGWTELWSRLSFGTDVPINTPATRNVFYTNTYTVQAACPQYMLEFKGKLMDEDDGWKFCLLELSAS